jgi:hypothetical protein
LSLGDRHVCAVEEGAAFARSPMGALISTGIVDRRVNSLVGQMRRPHDRTAQLCKTLTATR